MGIEKPGGREAKLTPDAEDHRAYVAAYETGYSEGEKEFRPENAAFAEHVLSTFHIDELKNVFVEYLEKSGVPAEQANTGVFDEILTRPLPKGAAASYNALVNKMSFSSREKTFLDALQLHKVGENIPESLLMKTRLFFIHEACHAFSRIRLSSQDISSTRSIFKEEVGYVTHRGILKQPPGRDRNSEIKGVLASFEALNEGVTQRIAEEIFVEYTKRVGESGPGAEFIKESNTKNASTLWQYSIYMNQVDSMCERIGEYVGMPKKEVWKGFKRGYFEDPQLFSEEIIELFKQTFDEGFLEAYSKLGNETDVSDLARFDATHGMPYPGEYAEKWLEYLGIQK